MAHSASQNTHRGADPAVVVLMDRIKAATGAPSYMTEDQLVSWLNSALEDLGDYRDAQMVMNTSLGWRSCRRPAKALALRFDTLRRLTTERRRMAKEAPIYAAARAGMEPMQSAE